VSSESFPCSRDDETEGTGGTESVGARNPFLTDDFDPRENRPFALGADATLRRKRDADAPTDFGLKGVWMRDRDGAGGVCRDGLEGLAEYCLKEEDPGLCGEL